MTRFGEGVQPSKIAMTPRGEAWFYHPAPGLGGAVVHRQGVRGTVAATLAASAARDYLRFQHGKKLYAGAHGIVTEEHGFAVKIFRKGSLSRYFEPGIVAGVTAVRAMATFEQGIVLLGAQETSPSSPYRFATPQTLAAFLPDRYDASDALTLPPVHVTTFEHGDPVTAADVGVHVPTDFDCQLAYAKATTLAGAPPASIYYDVQFDRAPHDLLRRPAVDVPGAVEVVKLDVMARPELADVARGWRPQ